MVGKYLKVISRAGINKSSRTGMVLMVVSLIVYVILDILRVIGVLASAKLRFLAGMTLPPIFAVGLVLAFWGWWRMSRLTGRSWADLAGEKYDTDLVQSRFQGSRLFGMVLVLVFLALFFLGGSSICTLRFMEEPEFCGTACHSVMNPEWVTYQDSPHAHVHCVDCHVGEGLDALVEAKVQGAWQMVSVTLDLLERPIPTPVHSLRPARETCEHCHWPEKFEGSRLKTIVHYQSDEASTPLYTTLNLKVGTGESARAHGIHWHIASENQVRYTSIDDEREQIISVEWLQPDGTWHKYQNLKLQDDITQGSQRIMDCVDCHNRATHIYEDPIAAIDDRLHRRMIDADLPFIRREALAAVTAGYNDRSAAMQGIAARLRGFYRREYPLLAGQKLEAIEQAVQVLQEDVYQRNVHPEMNIEFGSYENHLGHHQGGGCFRCHNEHMVDSEGCSLSHDCTSCHSILAVGSEEPFEFLGTVPEKAPTTRMHQYLQDEFLQNGQN